MGGGRGGSMRIKASMKLSEMMIQCLNKRRKKQMRGWWILDQGLGH